MTKKYHISIVRGTHSAAPIFRFRQEIFRDGQPGLDIDKFDERCHHFLISDLASNKLVCVFRALLIENSINVDNCYSSQFYDLSPLTNKNGEMLELGRFCISKKVQDPTILRLAWSELVKFIVKRKVTTVFGCSSFPGVDTHTHIHTFSLLKEKYLFPLNINPKVEPEYVFEFAKDLKYHKLDSKVGSLNLPPLLRFYLKMGAKVSGTAIFDFDLQTTHVFTVLNLEKLSGRFFKSILDYKFF